MTCASRNIALYSIRLLAVMSYRSVKDFAPVLAAHPLFDGLRIAKESERDAVVTGIRALRSLIDLSRMALLDHFAEAATLLHRLALRYSA
jgi:hypothetical protein